MPFSVKRWSGVPFDLLKRTAAEWSSDNATRWSASVAFYTLLSLAPLLVITVSIASVVYGKERCTRGIAVRFAQSGGS